MSSREVELVLACADLHPMAMLQGLVPLLDRAELGAWGELAQGIVVAAKLPQLIATHLHRGPVPYPDDSGYIARFLVQLPNAPAGAGGQPATARRALRRVQILQLEHSLNAGTFAARVVASTLAPVEASIAGAIGALAGVLHGGADQAAIQMADDVGEPDRAAAYVAAELAAGRKLMGIGHREYRTLDPRSVYAKQLARELSAGTPHAHTFATLEAIETAVAAEMAARNKSLHPNLEFYKGLVYRCLGVPDAYFTALFAMARVFGYLAHFAESRQDNRIIRPAARYVGPAPA